MKKALVATMSVVVVSAGAWLMPALGSNDCPPDDLNPADGSISVNTPLGGVCGSGDAGTMTGHLWLDGDSGNPGPAAGYISAGNDGNGAMGICADDNGGPAAGGTSPTCVNP